MIQQACNINCSSQGTVERHQAYHKPNTPHLPVVKGCQTDPMASQTLYAKSSQPYYLAFSCTWHLMKFKLLAPGIQRTDFSLEAYYRTSWQPSFGQAVLSQVNSTHLFPWSLVPQTSHKNLTQVSGTAWSRRMTAGDLQAAQPTWLLCFSKQGVLISVKSVLTAMALLTHVQLVTHHSSTSFFTSLLHKSKWLFLHLS